MIPVSLAKIPSLDQFTRYWGHEFCSSSDERGSILRPWELLKHTSVRELVVWSGTQQRPRPGSDWFRCSSAWR